MHKDLQDLQDEIKRAQEAGDQDLAEDLEIELEELEARYDE
jgi:hypothetical protein